MIEQFRMDGGPSDGRHLGHLATALAGAGARVVLSGRSQERGDEALRADGLRISIDVADAGSVSALVEEVVSSHGGLHVLVNSAAINIVKPALDHTPDLDALLASNVRGAFLCAQEAARAMVNRGGGGKIVFLTSMVAERAVPNQSAYIATKGAVFPLRARLRSNGRSTAFSRPGAATHQNADDLPIKWRKFLRERHRGLAGRARLFPPDSTSSWTRALALDDATWARARDSGELPRPGSRNSLPSFSRMPPISP